MTEDEIYQSKVVENFKLYRQYLECQSKINMLNEKNDSEEIISLNKRMDDYDKQIGCNNAGSHLITSYDIVFKKSLTSKKIKEGKCPEDFIDRWLRISNGKPEFDNDEIEITMNKKIHPPTKIDFGLMKYMNQLADILKIDSITTIRALNKVTIQVKIDKKIKSMVNNNQTLVDAYHLFFKKFDCTIKGLKLKGEKIKYQNCLKGKATKTELIDPEIALSIWQARNKLYGWYPVK